MIQFTQGDAVTLNLTAQDGNGNPINLTGASFSTQILAPNGVGIVTFPNSQHTILNAALGTFSLVLAIADTQKCGVGNNKDIVTTITQSGAPIFFRGSGVLKVWPPVPLS